MDTSKLKDLRKHIDEIDNQIITLIKKRGDIVKKIGKLKKREGIQMTLKGREQVIFEKLATKEKKHGFSPGFLKKIWQVLIAESKVIQKKILNSQDDKKDKN